MTTKKEYTEKVERCIKEIILEINKLSRDAISKEAYKKLVIITIKAISNQYNLNSNNMRIILYGKLSI